MVQENGGQSGHWQLGRDLRCEFLFGKDVVNLNHGSYGTFPRCVRDSLWEWQSRQESFPDMFLRQTALEQLEKSRELVARELATDANNVALVPNATAGINTVLRNLEWNSQDNITYLSTVYPGTISSLQYISDRFGVQLHRIEIDYPMSRDAVVEKAQELLESLNYKVKLACFDTLSSMPAAILPWQRLNGLYHQHGIMTLIDGAHGIGHIPLPLDQTQPDFLVTNAHKWLFTARSCAVLYVAPQHHHYIHSNPVSNNYVPASQRPPDFDNFVHEHSWTGTIDYSAYLTIPAAIQFRERCGGNERIREYCTQLARQGGRLAASIIGTDTLDVDNVHFTNVRLAPLPVDRLPSAEIIKIFMNRQMREFNCVSSVYLYNHVYYARMSAQVYNDLSDFEYVARCLKTIIDDING